MTKVFDGKKLASKIAEQLAQSVAALKDRGVTPRLVIVCIAPDERAQVYMRMKRRRAAEIGIETELHDLVGKSTSETKQFVEELGNRPDVSGIICQLPLTGWYEPQELIDCIPPGKDVDGLTSASQEALEHGKPGFVPATPLGVMEILKSENVDLSGKTVTVVGRSNLVGRPLALLLHHAGANVLVAHSQTQDLSELTLQSGIVISATGKHNLITADVLKPGVVVVDVGINEVDGKLAGDVDFEGVKDKASLITPVPGGVGPLTVIMLLSNTITAAEALAGGSMK